MNKKKISETDLIIDKWMESALNSNFFIEKEENVEFLPRPSRLGLGAKFVPHTNLEEVSKFSKKMNQSKKQENKKNEINEPYSSDEEISKSDAFKQKRINANQDTPKINNISINPPKRAKFS